MAILSYLWLWFGPNSWVWSRRSKSKCSWEAPFQHRHASFPSLDARIRGLCVQSTGMVGVTRIHTAVYLQHLRRAPKSASSIRPYNARLPPPQCNPYLLSYEIKIAQRAEDPSRPSTTALSLKKPQCANTDMV